MNVPKPLSMQRITLLSFVLVTFFACSAWSQSANAQPQFSDVKLNKALVLDSPEAENAFFADEEEKRYFIDFESLNVNINNVVVKDASGSTIWEDKVFDLPVDTIYEIDCSEYAPGFYVVELHSFTEVMRKEISIN